MSSGASRQASRSIASKARSSDRHRARRSRHAPLCINCRPMASSRLSRLCVRHRLKSWVARASTAPDAYPRLCHRVSLKDSKELKLHPSMEHPPLPADHLPHHLRLLHHLHHRRHHPHHLHHHHPLHLHCQVCRALMVMAWKPKLRRPRRRNSKQRHVDRLLPVLSTRCLNHSRR